MIDALSQFRAALEQRDIVPPDEILADGRIHRCGVRGKHGKDDGSYLLHLDGVAAGGFQNWQDGAGWEDWRCDLGRQLTASEEAEHKAKVASLRAQRDAAASQLRASAAFEAKLIMDRAKPGAPNHPYIKAKGIKSYGLRVNGNALIVPMRDVNGVVHSVQRIFADGTKRFLPNGRKQGCMCVIGKIENDIMVCEGFATGASLREALGCTVAVAFDAGNLEPVARALREKYPSISIVIAADDDAGTEGNPGITKAKEAAAAVGGVVIAPDFGENRPERVTDFNDVHQHLGLQAVDKAIQVADYRRPEQAKPTDGVILMRGSDVKPLPISWLWHFWVALGKLLILAGAPGAGKTTIVLAMIATLTRGGRWPDGSQCVQGSALIWSGEDDVADTLAPRLIAMGADMDRVHFITGSMIDGQSLPFDPARDLIEINAKAQAIGDVKLIMVDPVVSAVAGDSHKNAEVRRSLQPLVDLGARLGAAIIGITHLSKGTAGRDPTERVTGSIAFSAVARIVLLAAKIKDDQGKDKRVLVRSKANICPDDGGFEYHVEQTEIDGGIPTSIVTWGNAIEGSAKDLLADAESDGDQDEAAGAMAGAKTFLRELLTGPTPTKQVETEAKAAGHSWASVRRASEALHVIKKKGEFGWYWQLPKYPGKAFEINLLTPQVEQHGQVEHVEQHETDVEVAQVVQEAQLVHLAGTGDFEQVDGPEEVL